MAPGSARALVRGAERAAVLSRRDAHMGPEVVPQQRGRAEPGPRGDGLDREIAALQEGARVVQPLGEQPLAGGGAGLGGEPAGETAG